MSSHSPSSSSNSVEVWVLMALIYKDIDDFDYKNAVVLAERLYAVDKINQEYQLIYAKCLYLLHDYNGTYDVLKNTTSIPCRHLFARSCLELGNLADKTDRKSYFWQAGVEALKRAMQDYPNLEAKHNWADDLTSVAQRSHMPSQSTITNLLGELYIKLDQVSASAKQLKRSIVHNPFKLTAFTKLCDIAPDVVDFNKAVSPNEIFKEFNLHTTNLDRSAKVNLPSLPFESTVSDKKCTYQHTDTTSLPSTAAAAAATAASTISTIFASSSAPDDSPFLTTSNGTTPHITSTNDTIPTSMESYMPMLRSNYAEVTLDHLRSLVRMSIQPQPPTMIWDENIERSETEIHKDEIFQEMNNNIEKQRLDEAFKNKHGLHKKPPAETTQDLKVELMDDINETSDSFIDSNSWSLSHPAPRLTSDVSSSPPVHSIKTRLRNKRTTSPSNERTTKKRSTYPFGVVGNTTHQSSLESLTHYFVPWSSPPSHPITAGTSTHNTKPSLGNTTTGTTASALTTKSAKDSTDQMIIDAMNNVIRVIGIIAKGYMYQSSYRCRETALELQKLDDQQYDTASVLSLLGQAYYDSGNHQIARVFYRRSFYIAPWYCKGVPIYSTCLWYLEREQELNLLAYRMKDNHTHRYEGCIAAGNWTKCLKRGNEAIRWFQKAVELDPSRSYGHALLGYEEWEKGNCLGAKQHFAQCMMANKRSYFGWYGGATAYQGMHEFVQARTLMEEAIRLHPRHPVLLGTMAEILFSLKEYRLAYDYVCQSLAMRENISMELLKRKIKQKLESVMDEDDEDDIVSLNSIHV
ncbi:uncharacterized protein BX664DRAFT_285703 [Halteromyces radiatus]|uniref:uncharacterized protein n=1 Tax=Halteromyces radiatus TaxID=101107 RepID=UPI00221F586E|nr:uncharacterized protein BX664DRAFT_285703 [Halteromyces radiatus]KAI8081581.1 hypothetical protein BX664DRAFT_285703 [Halteromyces radiatus]